MCGVAVYTGWTPGMRICAINFRSSLRTCRAKRLGNISIWCAISNVGSYLISQSPFYQARFILSPFLGNLMYDQSHPLLGSRSTAQHFPNTHTHNDSIQCWPLICHSFYKRRPRALTNFYSHHRKPTPSSIKQSHKIPT